LFLRCHGHTAEAAGIVLPKRVCFPLDGVQDFTSLFVHVFLFRVRTRSRHVYGVNSRMRKCANVCILVTPKMDIFQDRSTGTRFRVLVELAAHQPSVQQKDVAASLGITVQAVSEHVKELVLQGWVVSTSKGSYTVTPQGVDWMLRMSRQLQAYSERVGRIVRDISVTAAIADGDFEQGQVVSLEMREGELHAVPVRPDDAVRATVDRCAARGSAVGVMRIEGVIPLSPVDVTVAVVPSIQNVSGHADLRRLLSLARDVKLVLAAGVEALVALRASGVEPACCWGVPVVAAEASLSGVSTLVVCSAADLPHVAERLAELGARASIIDVSL